MSAVNKSGKLNVNLCNFMAFVGARQQQPVAHCRLIIVFARVLCVCVLLFLMSICLPFDKFGPHRHSLPRPGHVSLVVCQLSGTPSRPLRAPLVAVLVYSLSHDFAVKCLQNV